MSAVFPPTPELPDPGYFSSSSSQFRHYEFYGENKIMSLFQTYQRLESNKSRHSVALATPKKQSGVTQAVTRRCGLSDKRQLYKLLGFQFNDTGDKTPLLKRRGSIVYRSPDDSRSFLEGMLIQKRHFSPLMCKSLMWLSIPFTNLPEVIMYVVDLTVEGFKVVKLTPQQGAVDTQDKEEGETKLKLWSCSRWLAHSVVCPDFLKESIDYLRTKCVMPNVITVDVLGTMVLDLHAQSCVPDHVFSQTCYVEVRHEADLNRPFYEQRVANVSLKD
jgi:hypothetical protein